MNENERRSRDVARGGAGDVTNNDVGNETNPEQLIQALEATVVQFERLIDKRSSDDLQQAAQDGGWGIVEILGHLQDWEEIVHDRVRRILEEDHPELEDYDDSLWAIDHEYGSQDGHKIFAHIEELRHKLIERLRVIENDAWNRTATLTGNGEITLSWLIQSIVKHDTRHLAQAREVFG